MPDTGETTSGPQNGPQTFRKKPVEIQAMQLLDSRHSALAIAEWSGGHYSPDSNPDGSDAMHFVIIPTPEGNMLASPGDWVIRGVAGEFWPCKPDIFAATYEPVTPTTSGNDQTVRDSVRELHVAEVALRTFAQSATGPGDRPHLLAVLLAEYDLRGGEIERMTRELAEARVAIRALIGEVA